MKALLHLIALTLPFAASCAGPTTGHDSDPLRTPSFFRGDWVGYYSTSGGAEWDAEHRAAFEMAVGGDIETALGLIEINLASARRHFGASHETVAAALNPLSYCNDMLGKRDLGPDHPDLAIGLENLGYMYAFESDFEKAEPLLLSALEINQRYLDPESDTLGMTYNHLGMMYGMMEDYEKALHYRSLALPIAEKYLGPNSIEYSNCLIDVAKALQLLDRVPEAVPLARQIVAVQEQALGYDHPDLAPAYFFLAELLHLQGKKEEANELTVLGLRIRSTGAADI
ncbi:MAG: tetratricopeptide repeat protein [Planctomycetes bacterium]|nr:tetratricopeptide repeat protein [Planctomycetota bacterium]